MWRFEWKFDRCCSLRSDGDVYVSGVGNIKRQSINSNRVMRINSLTSISVLMLLLIVIMLLLSSSRLIVDCVVMVGILWY